MGAPMGYYGVPDFSKAPRVIRPARQPYPADDKTRFLQRRARLFSSSENKEVFKNVVENLNEPQASMAYIEHLKELRARKLRQRNSGVMASAFSWKGVPAPCRAFPAGTTMPASAAKDAVMTTNDAAETPNKAVEPAAADITTASITLVPASNNAVMITDEPVSSSHEASEASTEASEPLVDAVEMTDEPSATLNEASETPAESFETPVEAFETTHEAASEEDCYMVENENRQEDSWVDIGKMSYRGLLLNVNALLAQRVGRLTI
ncbi:hypothetical protein B0T14DRAFT_529174 [Immersiella caudata]|uniref:Uncharacterized protein n=1 Tax=Immersiella caudata TaxID=314043 RepID=A0AA39TKQ0_9PEZI|nr:hypothetical protein B0T14DRAFT_529174 [Immersiella caudata]